MPRSKVELFAATRHGSPFLPLTREMPIPVETAAGSRDQQQDVFGSGTPCASGTVRWTGEVAAEKISLPLDADDQYGGAARHSAPTPGVGS